MPGESVRTHAEGRGTNEKRINARAARTTKISGRCQQIGRGPSPIWRMIQKVKANKAKKASVSCPMLSRPPKTKGGTRIASARQTAMVFSSLEDVGLAMSRLPPSCVTGPGGPPGVLALQGASFMMHIRSSRRLRGFPETQNPDHARKAACW